MEASFDGLDWPADGRRCGQRPTTRYFAVWCWEAIARPAPRSACCSSTARSERPMAVVEGQARRRHHRHAARPAKSRARLWQKPWAGQTAVTKWKVAASATGLWWLALEPGTAAPSTARHTSAMVADRRRQHLGTPRFGEPTCIWHSREDRDSDSKNRSSARGGAGAGARQERLREAAGTGRAHTPPTTPVSSAKRMMTVFRAIGDRPRGAAYWLARSSAR